MNIDAILILAALVAPAQSCYILAAYLQFRCLRRIALKNRAIALPMLWIAFVPGLNAVFAFVTVAMIELSLANELQDRGVWSQEYDFAAGHGFSASILLGVSVLSLVLAAIDQDVGVLLCLWLLTGCLSTLSGSFYLLYLLKAARRLQDLGAEPPESD